MKNISITTNVELAKLLEHVSPAPPELSFRGQSNAAWKLQSSLERSAQHKFGEHHLRMLGDYERDIIDWFIAQCQRYELGAIYPKEKLPDVSDTFEWLSLLRHSGYPTRLIDFTDDITTALYFSLHGSEATVPFAIFALQMRGDDNTGNKLPKDSNGNAYLAGLKQQPNINELLGLKIHLKSFKSWFDASSLPATWTKPKQNFGWDAPAVSNIRIDRQKGRFLYQLEPDGEIERIEDLTKYTISAHLYPSCVQILKAKGDRYSRRFLFPAFEGMEVSSSTFVPRRSLF